MRLLPAIPLLLLAVPLSFVSVKAEALVLAGARVLDPDGERWLTGRAVLIEEGRIAKIVPLEEIGSTDRRIDLGGLYLIPGLIDLHTHLLLHPYDEASWDDQVLREPLELRTIRATTAARATLQAGFTTIRDLGTEGAGLADVAIRDAVAQGMIPGPRLLAATRAIVATGCYGPQDFDHRWDVPQGAQEASGAAEVRKAVRQQVAAGADWVKVYADYRRGKSQQPTATFSQEELDALVDEARSANRPVAAHAGTSEGIRRAVLAGVATIEHGYQASDEVLSLMRERGVVLVPTLAASEAVARYAGWKDGEPDPPGVRTSKDTFSRALRLGVEIACGSDAGVFRHGDNAREIELMVAYGMSPKAALRAATSAAARVLGRERDLGRVAPGYVADLIAVREDPLKSASALRGPVLVLKEGKVALEPR
jgi:imidazolonepropionase-like amidohydrolase